MLDPSFLYPYTCDQIVENPFSPRVILLDKSCVGGHDYLRGKIDRPMFDHMEEEKSRINSFRSNRPTSIAIELSENFGLGGHLFQLAAAVSLAQHHGVSVNLHCNSSSLEKYNLSRLGCSSESTGMPERVYQEERLFAYDSGFFHLDRGIALKGWFQDWQYSESILPLLRKSLELPLDSKYEVFTRAIEQSKQAVAIHICRGLHRDNRAQSMRPIVPIEYYQKAIDLMLEHLGEGANFFIFTDEPDWVRAN